MKALLISVVLGIFSFIGFLFTPGEPVPGAEVYIEQEGKKEPVAYMQTGDNGKATFAHLQSGVYRIKMSFPRQSGKFMRGSDNLNCRLQVGYHEGKKQYFLRETEGFFTIRYSKIRRFANKNITPVYHPGYSDQANLIEVGKFEVTGNNGSFTLELRAQKPRKFAKMVEKLKDDVEMVTIRNAWP